MREHCYVTWRSKSLSETVCRTGSSSVHHAVCSEPPRVDVWLRQAVEYGQTAFGIKHFAYGNDAASEGSIRLKRPFSSVICHRNRFDVLQTRLTNVDVIVLRNDLW